jgi:hypothetical protein
MEPEVHYCVHKSPTHRGRSQMSQSSPTVPISVSYIQILASNLRVSEPVYPLHSHAFFIASIRATYLSLLIHHEFH